MNSIQSIFSKPKYIAIEGCIGVGKTTLCNALTNRFSAKKILEVVEENPFLPDFYADPASNAFKTQMFFLFSRYKQQQELKQGDLFTNTVVTDYFMVKDHIFADLTLSGSELALYEQVYQTLCNHIQMPDLIVYLKAPLEVILERIQNRGRPFEKSIDPQYLQNLIAAYDRYFAKLSECPVMIVETEELNFPERQEDVSHVVEGIFDMFRTSKNRQLLTAGTRKQANLF